MMKSNTYRLLVPEHFPHVEEASPNLSYHTIAQPDRGLAVEPITFTDQLNGLTVSGIGKICDHL